MQTIYIILTFFFIHSVSLINGIYLNKLQQTQIVNLVKSNQLSFVQREKINTILFEAYKTFAHERASYFKFIHKYKCRNIHINDLKLASEFGLMKAAHNYNGNSSFYYYSSLHIKNELLNSLNSLNYQDHLQ
jgi:DNA-directed RNA polymerase specialized sigma subunit